MNLVVVKTADAGGLDPSRLCFQIEHLTNGEEIPTVLRVAKGMRFASGITFCSMRKKVSEEIRVRPSKATALRR